MAENVEMVQASSVALAQLWTVATMATETGNLV